MRWKSAGRYHAGEYMARPCDDVLTLESQCLVCFLSMSLRAYKVPEDEIHRVLAL